MKRLIATITALVPTVAGAVDQPLGDTGSDFTYDKLVKIVTELVKIALRVGELLIIMAIVYYGVRMVMSRGEPGKFSEAKKGLLYAIVGGLIIFGVYTIIATVQSGVKSIG